MNLGIGDVIETRVGGPYEVISVKENLVTFRMQNGIGMTILNYVTKVISTATTICEYSGLPSVESYEK